MKIILKKLHDIMTEVDFIAKDKTNDFHKYNYASEQAIKETLHKLLVKHGVLFMLNSSNVRHTGTLTDIDFAYRFYDISSGELIEGTFVGTGEDKLDKGTYKAITGAIKYILTSTFLIPTGDDPEKDNQKKVSAPKTNNAGTQYENRQTTTAAGKIEFLPGDKLVNGISKKVDPVTGEPTNKPWYAIQRGKDKIWLKEEQYAYLANQTEGVKMNAPAKSKAMQAIEATFNDGAPLPQEY